MSDQGNQVAWWTDFSGEVAAAMGPVAGSVAAHQAASRQFIDEHGAEVLAGHVQVTGPAGGGSGVGIDGT